MSLKLSLWYLVKHTYNNITLQVNGVQIKNVERLKYLGSVITQDLDPDFEIKSKLEMVRTIFKKIRSFLCVMFY